MSVERLGFKTVGDIIARGCTDRTPQLPTLDPDDTCLIMATSGSTGRPKMVPWSHFNFMSDSHGGILDIPEERDNVEFNDKPFPWIGGVPLEITRVTVTYHNYANKSILEITDLVIKAVDEHHCTWAFLTIPCLMDLLLQKTGQST